MQQTSSRLCLLACASILAVGAMAHGHEEDDMQMGHDTNPASTSHGALTSPASSTASPTTTSTGSAHDPMSYFAYGDHSTSIICHIVMMTLAWVFVLPIGIMLSIARSRLSLPIQFSFLVLNGIGIVCGITYNTSTPDLYPNNAHHKMGWVAAWMMGAEVLMGSLFAFAGRHPMDYKTVDQHRNRGHAPTYSEQADFIPIRTNSIDGDDMDNHHSAGLDSPTSSGAESLRETVTEDEQKERFLNHDNDETGNTQVGYVQRCLRLLPYVNEFLSNSVTPRKGLMKALGIAHIVIERTILILGFAVISTGAVTYGGIMRGNHVFNGLAHFIKGGIFFWYGLLTLGRWIGCFADFGWAWNVKPSRSVVGKWKASIPTAEFTESFVIFLYGASNVFLEHLSGWGKAWAPSDLEHVSISILFFGGGLCGMAIESKRLRNWINTTIYHQNTMSLRRNDFAHDRTQYNHEPHQSQPQRFDEPKSLRISLNPIPALVIFMLGLMMSSHHQHSMLSSMIHSQWGYMLAGFSICRILTYILFYVKPPTSLLPSRPPTEFLAGFCLVGGGLVFMLSTADIVSSMDYFGLDGMFVFTVAMGCSAFLVAWEVALIAVKAWASTKSPLPLQNQELVYSP